MEKVLKPKFPFGKYKNKTIEYVFKNDRKYIEWLESKEVNGWVADAIENIRYDEATSIIKEIQSSIKKGEKVYSQDIHAVGIGFIIGDIHLEEVIGHQYHIYGTKNLKNMTRLDEFNFNRVQKMLQEQWIKDGKLTKDRGLY